VGPLLAARSTRKSSCGRSPRLHYAPFSGQDPLEQVSGYDGATIKAYLHDPTGEKARKVKARYSGVCRGCGAPTSPRGGKGDAYEYCKQCHPGAIALEWTRERVRDAMRAWHARYGGPPSSCDWSVSHASRRGREALLRLQDGEWPAASTVSEVYGSWAAARADAFPDT
jgi:hypothetical protein